MKTSPIKPLRPLSKESYSSDESTGNPDGDFSPLFRNSDSMRVSWHGINCSKNGHHSLHSLSGSLYPAGITALIGPSRAGKSTLLELLAGQSSSSAKLKGEIRVNSSVYGTSEYLSLRSSIAHISSRSDALLPPENSVREVITFHTSLRMRGSLSSIKASVEYILRLLSLSDSSEKATTLLTRGERIRTLIGIELVRTPSALFIDSPLECLDAFEAYGVFSVLRNLAIKRKISVMFSASRVSSEVFFACDRVVLLSRGSAIFEGTPNGLTDHLANCGHICPPQHAPADFAILLLQTLDWDEHRRIVENWRWIYGNSGDDDLIKKNDTDIVVDKQVPGRPPLSIQFSALVFREITRNLRNPGPFMLKLFTTAVISILIGCFFYKLGHGEILTDATALQNYSGAMAFVLLASLFGDVEGVAAAIPMTRSRFLEEHRSNLYGSLMFFVSQIIVEIPISLITNFVHLLATYWMVGLRGNFFYWWLNLFAVTVCTNSVGWLISSLSKSTLTAMQFLPVVFLPQILFSGVVIDVITVPQVVRWLSYFCYLKYISDLVFLTEFADQISLDNAIVTAQATSNQIIPANRNLYTLAVIFFIVGIRFIAAIALSRHARSRD